MGKSMKIGQIYITDKGMYLKSEIRGNLHELFKSVMGILCYITEMIDGEKKAISLRDKLNAITEELEIFKKENNKEGEP